MITYATAGAGHRRAAEALAQAVTSRFPNAHVQCVDVLDWTPRWFRSGYAWSYLFLVRRASWVWKISYHLLEHAAVYQCVQPLRRAWNLLMTRRFVRWLSADPPDTVVATHFLPADVCSAGKRSGWLPVPLVVVVTDLHPHRFWISPECDAMVVSTMEAAVILQRRGLTPERIHVIGIPIARAFSRPEDRGTLQARFRLQPGRLTVLVTSGGTTVGQFERVVRSLLSLEAVLPGRLQLLVVCGEDAQAHHRLSGCAASSAMPLTVFGFIDNMAEVMAASDLIVAKAGGLTVTEALGRGIPLILYHVIPGQERENARYLASHGAAIIAPRPADVAQAVRRCVEEPRVLDGLQQAAAALSRPHAAEAIVAQVVEPLLQKHPL